MEVIIQPDREKASLIAARIVARALREKPNLVLGLATGNTPLHLYQELIRLHQRENLDFSQVTTFNLDEYVGLPPEHPSSYTSFMLQNLFQHINVPPERIHIPNGMAADIPAECRLYEEAIRAAGGIDLQILGIGSDGHIGFNEPSSALGSRTRIKTLTEQTRRDNAPFFGGADKVPQHVITMGIGTILDSRSCLLLAFGAKKAETVAAMVEGAITASVPASALQLHAESRVILDAAAGKLLRRQDYYRWVYDHKPGWQKL